MKKEELRKIETRLIDEWDDFDLRITCQQFDIFEAGCFCCPHNSEGRGHLGLDHRLTCHLEQEMKE